MSTYAEKADRAVGEVASVGMGQKTPIGTTSDPLHPATVHFPIGLWTLAFSLDSAQHFAPGLFPQTVSTKGLLTRFIPPAPAVPMLSHYLNGAGILFATITIATGVSELLGMWQGQAKQKGGYMAALKDAYTASEDDIPANKLKTTITHATMNDSIFALCAYNFYKRATSPGLALPPLNAWMSTAALPLFMYSAYLGGSLVYKYGVGVMRQGAAAEVKEKQQKQQ